MKDIQLLQRLNNLSEDFKSYFLPTVIFISLYAFITVFMLVQVSLGISDTGDKVLYLVSFGGILPLSYIGAYLLLSIARSLYDNTTYWMEHFTWLHYAFPLGFLIVLIYYTTIVDFSLELMITTLLLGLVVQCLLNLGLYILYRLNYRLNLSIIIFLSTLISGCLTGYFLQNTIQYDSQQIDNEIYSIQVYPRYGDKSVCFKLVESVKTVKSESNDTTQSDLSIVCENSSTIEISHSANDNAIFSISPYQIPPIQVAFIFLALTVFFVLSYKYQSPYSTIAMFFIAGFTILFGISWTFPAVALLIGILLWYALPQLPSSKAIRVAVDFLVIVLILLVTINLEFPQDRWHFNAYLAPINDIINGKSLLVDTTSQYGVMSNYIMAIIFGLKIFPLNFVGFSLFVSLLTSLSLISAYILYRFVSKSLVLSALAISLSIVLILDVSHWDIVTFPSTGILRFGPLYPLALVIMARYCWYQESKYAKIAELIVFGITVYWSIFAAAYVIGGYMMLTVLETLDDNVTVGQFVRKLFVNIGTVAIVIVSGFLIVNLFTFMNSGNLPNWSLYIDYVVYFSSNILTYIRPITNWHPEFLLLTVGYLALVTVIFERLFIRKMDKSRVNVFAYILVSGILQVYYYISLSISFHFALIFIPAGLGLLFIANFLYDEQKLEIFKFISMGLLATALFTALIPRLIPNKNYEPITPGTVLVDSIFNQGRDNLLETVKERWSVETDVFYGGVAPHEVDLDLYVVEDENVFQPVYKDWYLHDALNLIRTYSPSTERLGLFIQPESTTQTLVTLGRSHVYPIANISAEIYSATSIESIMNYDPEFKIGDMIYTQKNIADLVFDSVQDDTRFTYVRELVENICEQYSFRLRDISQSDITAIELIQHDEDYKCDDDTINFKEILLDIGTLFHQYILPNGWYSAENWDDVTIQWMQNEADVQIPVCLDSNVTVSMRIFNPSDNDVELTVVDENHTEKLIVNPGWGEYSFGLSQLTCSEDGQISLALSTLFTLDSPNDSRQLSLAFDWISITE